MARPVDPERRAKTLAAAADYVLGHGLAGLSLRPLAKALHTSPRMLLYDFTSKDELVVAVLAEIRRRESALLTEYLDTGTTSPAPLVRTIWAWLSSAERAPFLRVFEVYVDAMTRPDTHSEQGRAMVTDWLGQFGAAFAAPSDQAGDTTAATLVIAVLRGLVLDRLNTADHQRTDRALERFIQLLDRPEGGFSSPAP